VSSKKVRLERCPQLLLDSAEPTEPSALVEMSARSL